MAVTLAIKQPEEEEYQRFAANIILRWKQVYAEEEAVQRQQLAQSDAPEIVELKKRITESQGKLSQALHHPEEMMYLDEQIEQFHQEETAMLTLARHLRKNLKLTR